MPKKQRIIGSPSCLDQPIGAPNWTLNEDFKLNETDQDIFILLLSCVLLSFFSFLPLTIL